jgi:hypothetical protein
MKGISFYVVAALVLTGCQFSKSVKKDLISGLTTTGDILTCNNVHLTINNEQTTRNTFNYGEMVYLVYDDIQGFTKENGKVFPLMQILVRNIKGDTVLWADDLYSEYTEGMDFSPLELTADLTVATPINSGGEYELFVKISDRKGKGTYSSNMKFTVSKNEKLQIEPDLVTYNEVYIFSQDDGKVIIDNRIRFEDNIYIIIEGLKGFREENGVVFPGLSLKGIDASNNVILDYSDLFGEYGETGIEVQDFSSGSLHILRSVE